ncbi:hypothetical protein EBS02_07675 [bacterium]|nr:hypothetical protein [bacterium]
MDYQLRGKDFDALYFLLNIKKHGTVNKFISSITPDSKKQVVLTDLSRSVKQLEHLLGTSLRTKAKPQQLNSKGLLIADELTRLEFLIDFFKRDILNKVVFFGAKSYTDIFVTSLCSDLFKKFKVTSVIKNGNSEDTIKALTEGSADIYLVKKSAFENLSLFARKSFIFRPLRDFYYQWAIPSGKSVSDITSGNLPTVGLSLQGETMNFLSRKYKRVQWASCFPYFKDVVDFAQLNQFAAIVPSYFSNSFHNYKFLQIEGSERERILVAAYKHIYKSSQNVKYSFECIFSRA